MNNYVIPNLVKSCAVMKLLADRPKGITAFQVEEAADVPRTTAFRILKTLCSEGFAQKRGKLYFAGPGLIQIGLTSLKSLEIRTLSIPFLSKLAENTDFTAHLAIPGNWNSLILEVHDSPNPLRVASRSGTTVPLHCSSTGKVFLAFKFEDRLKDYFSSGTLRKYTDRTITDLPGMLNEIERIKADGIAVDRQEFHEGIWCAAAPVSDSSGQVTAAIGVTGPAVHADNKKKSEICKYVKETATRLSGELGYNS